MFYLCWKELQSSWFDDGPRADERDASWKLNGRVEHQAGMDIIILKI